MTLSDGQIEKEKLPFWHHSQKGTTEEKLYVYLCAYACVYVNMYMYKNIRWDFQGISIIAMKEKCECGQKITKVLNNFLNLPWLK